MASLFLELLNNPEFSEGKFWNRRHLSANTRVFSEGDQSDEIYLVLAGELRVLGNVDLDQHRRIEPGFGELGRGDLFGELAAFDNLPRSATVVTLTDVELAVIDRALFWMFLDEHPETGYSIMKQLAEILVLRLRSANHRIFSLFAWGLKTRGIDSLF